MAAHFFKQLPTQEKEDASDWDTARVNCQKYPYHLGHIIFLEMIIFDDQNLNLKKGDSFNRKNYH